LHVGEQFDQSVLNDRGHVLDIGEQKVAPFAA
jgi:hypothetical protein